MFVSVGFAVLFPCFSLAALSFFLGVRVAQEVLERARRGEERQAQEPKFSARQRELLQRLEALEGKLQATAKQGGLPSAGTFTSRISLHLCLAEGVWDPLPPLPPLSLSRLWCVPQR